MLKRNKMMSLAAAACTLLGMSASEAAVTLTFAQVGPNVVATWSGTYSLPTHVGDVNMGSSAFVGGTSAVTEDGTYHWSAQDGTSHLSSFVGIANASSRTGPSFGFHLGRVLFPVGAGGTTISPTASMTFNDWTLSELGANAYHNFLAYEGSNNIGESSKIYYNTAAVPEPSTAFLSVLGVLAICSARRR